MTFQIGLSRFGEGEPEPGAPPRVRQGDAFFAMGWAADPDAGAVPRSVIGVVDGATRVRAAHVVRLDVVKTFGDPRLAAAGFDLAFSTRFLALGRHELRLLIETNDGGIVDCGARPFDVIAPAPEGIPWPRVLVAGAPKSGSSYTRAVLARYFDAGVPPAQDQGWEHNLDGWLLDRMHGRAFVVQMHMKAHPKNLSTIRAEGMHAVVTWRNCADTVISLDDHIRNERTANFIFEVDHDKYLAMADQDRYAFLIRHAIPWYLNFYVGWKEAGFPIRHYERMSTDPRGYFSDIVRAIAGSVDEARLDRVLGTAMTFEESRKNVGKNARSLERLSERTRALLEDTIQNHYLDLGELLDELPWRQRQPAP